MTPAVYLINLDRRSDRLAAMSERLAAIGLSFERVAAVDGRAAPPGRLHPRIPDSGHLIRMGRGSQAFAATFLGLCEKLLSSDRQSAIVLQDDIEVAADLTRVAEDDAWVPDGIHLAQFEQFGDPGQAILLGPSLGQAPTSIPRQLHPLLSRRGGAACFWFDRFAAEAILSDTSQIAFPTDHLLFSPNVSPVFGRLGVAMLVPAVARQQMEVFTSDIKHERTARKSRAEALRRGLTELNQAPRQLLQTVTRRAKWTKVTYQA